MTIECSNFSVCGNNTGNWTDPNFNVVSNIFCSEECSIAIDSSGVVYTRGVVVTYDQLMPTYKELYDRLMSLNIVKVEATPSVGTIFTFVDGFTLKVVNDE